MWVVYIIAAGATATALFIGLDARKRGRNSLFWFVLTMLLFGICAIPVYCYSINREKRSARREPATEGIQDLP